MRWDIVCKYAFLVIVWGLTVGFVLALLSGCQEKMTQAEWQKKYKPTDVNSANAMVVLETGQAFAAQKVAAQRSVDYVKLVCVVGCVASIAAIVLGTATLQGLGFSGLVICLASICLIQFYTTWPQWFAYGGGLIALGAGGYAMWKHKAALAQVVSNVEQIKTDITNKKSAKDVVDNLNKQTAATKSLVTSIRSKL